MDLPTRGLRQLQLVLLNHRRRHRRRSRVPGPERLMLMQLWKNLVFAYLMYLNVIKAAIAVRMK